MAATPETPTLGDRVAAWAQAELDADDEKEVEKQEQREDAQNGTAAAYYAQAVPASPVTVVTAPTLADASATPPSSPLRRAGISV